MRAALYPRVSTEEQHINGLSLPAQKKALEDYALAHGYEIVGVYADEGISARKPVMKRPALLRMLEDVKKDKIDIILVTKLDRWFRNIKEYHITQEILEAHHCHWKTVYENYDTSTANGQMVINIMLSVAQSESDRTSERIKTVFRYKESQGMVPTGMCAPYGYRINDAKRIEKDPETRKIVEDAIEFYFTWFSKYRTFEYLQEKYGEQAPTFNQVDRIFKNSKYWGEWRENPYYCEPYLTSEQARQLKSIKDSRTSTAEGYHYIFTGLLRCPVCGCVLTGYRKLHHNKNGGTSVYRRYRCQPKYNRHSAPNITEGVVEEYLLTHVVEQLEQEILEAQRRKRSQKKKDPAAALRAERNRLNNMYLKGRISEEYYDERYAELTEKISQYQTIIEIDPKDYAALQHKFSGDWMNLYNGLDNLHKQAFWKGVIKEIRFDEKTHKIKDFSFLI